MPPTERLAELPLSTLTARIAERTATPGGGSAAAALLALGAGLVAMACRFTSGEKHAAVERAMAERALELDRLRGRALPLVDEDSAAYDAVSAAYKLPKATDEEKRARGAAVQAAVRGALEVPFATLEAARAALRVAAAAAGEVNPNLASDCATGAWCLRGAAEGAMLNVRINAASLADKALAAERLAAAEEALREARGLAEAALASATAKLA